MHFALSAARWLALLILGALVPKLLKAIFTKLPPPLPPVTLPTPDEAAPPSSSAGARREGTCGFAAGDVVDGRFQLSRYIGRGKLSEIWEAEDSATQKRVAIRFLLSNHLSDASLIRRFSAAARVTGNMWRFGTPPVTFISRNPDHPYYVCEFHDGERLTTYAETHKDNKSKLGAIDGICHIAKTLSNASNGNILHGVITPEDILIDGSQWALVDFERGCRLTQAEGIVSVFPSVAFSAPECFEGDEVDESCDVYNLGRILEFVYCDGDLPTPFVKTQRQVLDRVNCSLELKSVLRRATAAEPKDRYQTLSEFTKALTESQAPEKSQTAILGIYFQEREKIARFLLYCVAGVAAVMLPTRALMTLIASSKHVQYGWVQLSDRPIVGAFHGLIGSVVWGSAIPLSFLLVWPLQARKSWFGALLATVVGGAAGFAGGVVCSYLSVKVTSLTILKSLGWLLPNGLDSTRVAQTVYTTRMFFAFPLEGMLTGCGIGLYLFLKMKRLRGASLQGLDPMPSKTHREERYALQAAIEFVSKDIWLQTVLLCPVIFSWFVAESLRPYGVDAHQEWHRTLGEGFVQAVGATGLVIGFFWGVVAPPESSVGRLRWRKPLLFTHKLLQLAKQAED